MTQRTICFCNSNIPWGGGEKWHLEAALAFAQKGWKVFVLCHPNSKLLKKVQQYPQLTPFAIALGKLSFLNPFVNQRLKSFLQQQAISTVIMNLPIDVKCIAPAAKQANVTNIYYRRGSAIAIKNSMANRWLFRLLTGVIVNSAETMRLLCANYPLISQNRIHLIPNGISIATFDTNLTNAQKLPAYKGLVIGNAGRLNKQKAQHLLLYLCKELQTLQCPFTLLIAGEGEREQELKQLAHTLGIAEHVHFLGFMDDLSSFWASINVFVLTSLWEGFGYVLAEAMLARKPVAAFAISNIPELIQNNHNGLLFPLPKHAESTNALPNLTEMAQALASLYNTPDDMKAMGEAGRTFACQNFSHEASMDTLEQLLIGQPTHHA